MVRTLALLTALAIPSSLLGQRKGCGETKKPTQLPSVSVLLDSTDAIVELQQFNVLRDEMRFSLLFDKTDSLPKVRALDSTDAKAALVLARSMWPKKPSDVWAVRVHVVGGASPALTLERAMYCPPSLRPGSNPPIRIVVGPIQEQRARVPAVRGPPTSFVLEILVAETGDVVNVRVAQSSGAASLDEELQRRMMQQHFEPALIDGFPVRAIYRTDGHSPRL